MPFSQILAISCFLTGVVMAVFIVGLLLAMRFGQQWIQEIVERFTNPDKNRDKNDNQRREQAVTQQQPQVASSQALRQRAQSLDFPAPAGNFAAQAAPQGNAFAQQNTNPQQPARATLRARDQYPDFNPQTQQQPSQQGFQPTMPSLSASRPYQGVAQPQQPQYPQQQGFQQAQQPQYPQQQGFPPAPLPPQQQGFQPLRPPAPQPPQAPQYPPQQGFQQQPQGNFQPLRPQAPLPPQYPQQPPQQGFQQQGFQQAPLPPQQGGLGEYRPGLNNAPRPDLRTQSQRPIRRDTRRQDDQMDEGGLDGLIDDAGDLIGF